MKNKQQINNEITNVILWYNEYPMLLAKSNTGINYNNQVGGVLCKQGCIEGFIIPLPINNLKDVEILNPEFWLKLDWNKDESFKMVDTNTKKLVEIINSLEIYKLKNFQIINNNTEAWFQCKFIYDDKVFEGILTWENSD